MLLYRCMGDNISDAETIGLWNGNRCYIGRWGNIPDDEIFRLWNNECSLYGCMGAIYQMQDYWSVEQRTLL